MRTLALLLSVLSLGCGSRSEPRVLESARADSVVGSGIPFEAAKLAAYLRGREQEVEILRSGGAVITSAALDSLGAAAAGLSVPEYRALVDTVDRYLKDRAPRSPDAFEHPAHRLDSIMAVLDSLRVERLVLTVRLGD